MNSIIRSIVRLSGLTLAASCTVVMGLSGCGTGAGGSQNPSTPYKGATPWNIADGDTPPRVARADTAPKK